MTSGCDRRQHKRINTTAVGRKSTKNWCGRGVRLTIQATPADIDSTPEFVILFDDIRVKVAVQVKMCRTYKLNTRRNPDGGKYAGVENGELWEIMAETEKDKASISMTTKRRDYYQEEMVERSDSDNGRSRTVENLYKCK